MSGRSQKSYPKKLSITTTIANRQQVARKIMWALDVDADGTDESNYRCCDGFVDGSESAIPAFPAASHSQASSMNASSSKMNWNFHDFSTSNSFALNDREDVVESLVEYDCMSIEEDISENRRNKNNLRENGSKKSTLFAIDKNCAERGRQNESGSTDDLNNEDNSLCKEFQDVLQKLRVQYSIEDETQSLPDGEGSQKSLTADEFKSLLSNYDVENAFPVPLSRQVERRHKEMRQSKRAGKVESSPKSSALNSFSTINRSSFPTTVYARSSNASGADGNVIYVQEVTGCESRTKSDTKAAKEKKNEKPKQADLLRNISIGFFSGREIDVDAISSNPPQKIVQKRSRKPKSDLLKDIGMGFFSGTRMDHWLFDEGKIEVDESDSKRLSAKSHASNNLHGDSEHSSRMC